MVEEGDYQQAEAIENAFIDMVEAPTVEIEATAEFEESKPSKDVPQSKSSSSSNDELDAIIATQAHQSAVGQDSSILLSPLGFLDQINDAMDPSIASRFVVEREENNLQTESIEKVIGNIPGVFTGDEEYTFTGDGETEITDLQEMLRETYLENEEDLGFYQDKVENLNNQKEAIRDFPESLRTVSTKSDIDAEPQVVESATDDSSAEEKFIETLAYDESLESPDTEDETDKTKTEGAPTQPIDDRKSTSPEVELPEGTVGKDETPARQVTADVESTEVPPDLAYELWLKAYEEWLANKPDPADYPDYFDYPGSLPDDVPEAMRRDYEEALAAYEDAMAQWAAAEPTR